MLVLDTEAVINTLYDGWWLAWGGYYGASFQVFRGVTQGGTTVPHHFQCGGGRRGASLYLVGDRKRRRAGQVVKGGATPGHLFLLG